MSLLKKNHFPLLSIASKEKWACSEISGLTQNPSDFPVSVGDQYEISKLDLLHVIL
ncbi:MAG: hypothetical protein QE493_03605 [Verrucomicrobiae bacterium]|nr:hypothetical protein [Verrucomicrobiae bacterium]